MEQPTTTTTTTTTTAAAETTIPKYISQQFKLLKTIASRKIEDKDEWKDEDKEEGEEETSLLTDADLVKEEEELEQYAKAKRQFVSFFGIPGLATIPQPETDKEYRKRVLVYFTEKNQLAIDFIKQQQQPKQPESKKIKKIPKKIKKKNASIK